MDTSSSADRQLGTANVPRGDRAARLAVDAEKRRPVCPPGGPLLIEDIAALGFSLKPDQVDSPGGINHRLRLHRSSWEALHLDFDGSDADPCGEDRQPPRARGFHGPVSFGRGSAQKRTRTPAPTP
jgi:hypothetical protein